MQRPKINNIRKLHIQKQPLLAGGCFFGERAWLARGPWRYFAAVFVVCTIYILTRNTTP